MKWDLYTIVNKNTKLDYFKDFTISTITFAVIARPANHSPINVYK